MKLLYQFGIILFVTFLGEICYFILPFPIPASIYGLLFMLFALCTKIIKLDQVKAAADFMLTIMPPMFIPSAVGVIAVWTQLKDEILSIAFITVLTTILVMVVTGRVSQFFIRKYKKRDNQK